MRQRRAPLTATLVSLALLVAACGGGDDARAPAGTSPGTDATTSSPAGPDLSDDVTLATEGYIWGYPLVVTMRTMQRLGQLTGVNRLLWGEQLAGPSTRLIVAPNRDTIYSIAVLDLRGEPMALTVPEITDRYYTYQFLDAWTESFAYVGTRATGGGAGTWVVTPPGWEGELPDGAQRIESATPQVFLLGRYLVDDEADIANVLAYRDQVRLEPLSTLTGATPAPAAPPLEPPVGSAQEVSRAGIAFWDELGHALAVNPPATDRQRALLAELERLGVGPGREPSTEVTDPEVLEALAEGVTRGDATIEEAAEGVSDQVNGWRVNLDVGRYGDDLRLRAAVAHIGWGANVPEEAVYPVSRADVDGVAYSGANRYLLHFDAGQLPPVDAFWSLSMYGEDNFFAENVAGRYAIGDRTQGLRYNDDGSLDLFLQHDPPAGNESNWLPAPQGEFNLMLRFYLPQEEILTGAYEIPPVEQVG